MCLVVGAAPLLLGCVAESAAATVYRCGNVYTDRPCPNAVRVGADDPRSDADQAAAHEVASREAALAARMESDRLQAEASTSVPRPARAKRQAAAASSPAHDARERSARLTPRKNDTLFVAVEPVSGRRSAKP